MRHEATQKGNPHCLTKHQHIFPAASIRRFVDYDGRVQTFSFLASKVLRLKPSDQVFCALRVWDQRTEVAVGKTIEDRFQQLANSIMSGVTHTIGLMERRVVDDLFSLWRTRHRFYIEGLNDILIPGIKGDELTHDEEERLEKKHVIFVREGGVMPGRFSAGPQVFGYLDSFRHANSNRNWGIVRAQEGEFVVPDCFQDLMIMPVSPTVSLVADHRDAGIPLDQVAMINREAVARSTHHYFARNLSSCPL